MPSVVGIPEITWPLLLSLARSCVFPWNKVISSRGACQRQLLRALGEKCTVKADLPAGPYRLRTLHPGAFVDLEHRGSASQRANSKSRRRFGNLPTIKKVNDHPYQNANNHGHYCQG